MRDSLHIFNGDYDLINAKERAIIQGGIKTIVYCNSKPQLQLHTTAWCSEKWLVVWTNTLGTYVVLLKTWNDATKKPCDTGWDYKHDGTHC